MSHWQEQLKDDAEDRRREKLDRALIVADRCTRAVEMEVDGVMRQLLNLAGNDYLGLASHPSIIEAVKVAADQWGVGSGASRLISGHLDIHHQFETEFARFKHAEAALVFPTGYMANLAVLTTLANSNDVVILDKLCHASLVDAAHMSGATVRVYPHSDLAKLERLLGRATAGGVPPRRRIIVTDSVFSMDGDVADLPAICELRDRYEAILVIDEAHGTGVFGKCGSGLAEQQGVEDRIDVTVSTASKALGCLGGMVTSSRLVIDAIVNNARSFIYTTSVPPTQVAAIRAAVQVIQSEPERRDRLKELSVYTRNQLIGQGHRVEHGESPIIPIIIGDIGPTIRIGNELKQAGYLASAIRPPTVAPGTSRLRISLRCDMTESDIDGFVDALTIAMKD